MSGVPSAPPDPADITGHLAAARTGGRAEVDALFSAVYQQLRAIARRRVGERGPINATGLVHEAYLRLTAGARPDWQDRQHFFRAAARAMRHIVVDQVRQVRALKRGGDGAPLSLDEITLALPARLDDVLAVDEALERIGDVDPRLVQVVELCFFAGFTTDEAGEALDLSARTVKRDWQKARALLQVWLGPAASAEPEAP